MTAQEWNLLIILHYFHISGAYKKVGAKLKALRFVYLSEIIWNSLENWAY